MLIRSLAAGILALLATSTIALPGGAQRPEWTGKAQVNASLFFGATDQRLIGTDAELSRADSAWEVRSSAAFRYGESSDGAVRTVQARSWIGALALDARPFASWSPFAFGSMASTYEQRIARRTSGGAGVKWTFVRTPSSRASIGAAALAERTRALPADDVPAVTTTVGRWSLRLKLDRRDDRSSFAHVTLYQPRITEVGSALVINTSQFAYSLSGAVAATVSVSNTYDSEARARGARSNSDGQLLVGLAVSLDPSKRAK